MSALQLRQLFGEMPFFGGATAGLQGNPLRHAAMIGVVHRLAGTTGAPRILEIGSWVGFSTLTWAAALIRFFDGAGTIVCVDPWTDYIAERDAAAGHGYDAMKAFARSGLTYDLFRHNVSVLPRDDMVVAMRGSSHDVLPLLAPAGFDAVFIDGSHAHADVASDIANAKRLVRDGGFVCGDDLELRHDECDPALMASEDLLDWMPDPRTGRYFHPGVTRAVGEAFDTVTSYYGFWVARRQGDAFVAVDLAKAQVFVPPHFPPDMAERLLEVYPGLRQ